MLVSSAQALWFLPFVVPIFLYTFFVDMKYKKIGNLTVWALFAVFVGVGLFTMPFGEFLWRFSHYAVVFVIGLAMWFMGQVGAGDVKFAAVMALYIHVGDIRLMMVIAAAAMLAALVTTVLARVTGLSRLAPHWAAWAAPSEGDPNSDGRGRQHTIPFGTALGLMLCAYLVLGALVGR